MMKSWNVWDSIQLKGFNESIGFMVPILRTPPFVMRSPVAPGAPVVGPGGFCWPPFVQLVTRAMKTDPRTAARRIPPGLIQASFLLMSAILHRPGAFGEPTVPAPPQVLRRPNGRRTDAYRARASSNARRTRTFDSSRRYSSLPFVSDGGLVPSGA